MRMIDRDHDSISLDLNLDRTAFWMTIHGAAREHNRVLPLSAEEARLLAQILLSHVAELERESAIRAREADETEWAFINRRPRFIAKRPAGVS